MKRTRITWHWIILPLILLLGLGLRLWGISFGLPYLYHPDEGVPVTIALGILKSGNLNPNFYNWPSLLFYLNAVVYAIYFGASHLLGSTLTPSFAVPDIAIMAVGKTNAPEVFLLGRGLSAVFGTGSILWVYRIAQQVSANKWLGYAAALLFAVEAVDIKHSQFIRPDTFAVFFGLWVVYFALKIVDDPRPVNYVLAGIGIGLTASSKYNSVIVCVAVLAAHLLYFGKQGFLRKEIYWCGIISVLVFLLTTPFALLDWRQFLRIGPLEDAQIYSTGHPGAEGNTVQFYLQFLWQTQGWLFILALFEIIYTLIRRTPKDLVLLSFPLVYYVFINFYTVHFDTTILPVLPYLVILGAISLGRIYHLAKQSVPIPPQTIAVIAASVIVILAWNPMNAAVANNIRLLQPDGRETARQWLDENLALGSRVAVESYSPYIDRTKFVVEGFYGLQDHSADWYIANGFEYLVFSQGVYGRYFADPARYAIEVEQYRALFARFAEVNRFDDNGFEIRVYKTGVKLPAQRVAVRYGDHGELIELIGYDRVDWKPGEPLHINLVWRTLTKTPEPFAVELRLLAQDDREIGSMHGDLFQGRGWQTGIFNTTWVIPVAETTSAQAYRLQVNVVWTKYAYSLPAFTLLGDRVEPVLLGPINYNSASDN